MTPLHFGRPEGPVQLAGCSQCVGIGTIEATDLFCGAGGSSLGLEHVSCPSCGRQLIHVTQALNHWDLAVEAHNANFPNADHDVHDVQQIPASRFRRTPILWASTECTHHAYCRGPKDLTDEGRRSRMTNEDVVRFAAHHHYDAIIVENVIEMRLWCDELGHKDKCNCGTTFDAWFKAMCDIGYDAQIVYFNSQFAFVPQSRDRMYVVFWRNGIRQPVLDFRPPSWCSECQTVVHGIQQWKKPSKGSARDQPGKYEWGRYGTQYTYTCPECHNHVAPAVVGSREIINWSYDMTRIGDRPKPLAPKTMNRIKVGIERLQAMEPITVQVGGHLFERQGYARVWSVNAPLRTVTGTPYMGLVVRAGGQGGKGRGTDEPMQTVIGHDRQVAFVAPGKSKSVPHTTNEPAPTITGRAHAMLVKVNRGGERRAMDLGEPMPTVAGHGEQALVSFRNHGDMKPLEQPAHTVCGGGLHHGVLVYNGVPGFVRSLEDAAGTVTSRDKQSLLMPYYSTGVAHPIAEPACTVTTKDRQALVMTVADIEDCYFRMLQWPELLRAQAMHEHSDGRAYELTAMRKNHRGKMVELSNELRTKMIGNAVSSPVAAMFGQAIVDVLR